MFCDLDSIDADRALFNISSALAEPLCQAFRYLRFRMVSPLDPTKFECRKNLVEEVALRVLLGTTAFFSLIGAPLYVIGGASVLGIGHKLLRTAAYAFQKEGCTHVRGSAPEKVFTSPELKVVSWNHCGPGGGMSIDHGGVVDWRYRVDAIVSKIEEENADILVLQEYYDTAFVEALITRLESKYAHFFTHLGQNVIGSESGVMVLSKAAVHRFSFTSFSNNHWTLNRGFASLEIKTTPEASVPFCRIIGTHLIHGDTPEDLSSRMVQIAEITESIRRNQNHISTVLAGDLNIERDGEGKTVLSSFRHGYQGKEPTCTNRMVAKWDLAARGTWGETIDYISLYKDPSSETLELANCHLVRAYDETYNTQTALSDHNGVALTIKGF